MIYAIEESLILTPLYRGTLLDDVENLRIANLTWHNLEAENDSKFAENYPDGRLDALRKKIASILKSFGSAEELESGEAQRAVLQRITNNCLLARRKDMLQGRYALKG